MKNLLILILLLLSLSDCSSQENFFMWNSEEISEVFLPTVATSQLIAKKSAPDGTVAISLAGQVTFDGGSPVIRRGFCWSTTPYPSILGDTIGSGSGDGDFYGTITVPGNSNYFYKAYAINSEGVAYGELCFIDLVGSGAAYSIPVVTTNQASMTSSTTIVTGGTVTSGGGGTIVSRGVCWSTNKYPTIADQKTTNGSGTGTFTSTISGVVENTTYYYRAYATNSYGITGYGDQLSILANYTFQYDVGDSYGGGVIFYIDTSHSGQKIVYISSNTLGTLGKYYTWWQARDIAAAYSGGGFTDWYLMGADNLVILRAYLNTYHVPMLPPITIRNGSYWAAEQEEWTFIAPLRTYHAKEIHMADLTSPYWNNCNSAEGLVVAQRSVIIWM